MGCACCKKKQKKNEVQVEQTPAQIQTQNVQLTDVDVPNNIKLEPERIPKKEIIKSHDISEVFNQSNNFNNSINQLAASFKVQSKTLSKTASLEKLNGPKSFVVPRNYIPHQLEDVWADYDSHKYLAVNIVEYYLKQSHLPMPPSHISPKLQEAYMTLNLLRNDPEYIIENLLLPAKLRFFEETTRPFIPMKSYSKNRFNSWSFGTIVVKNGPEIIDEIIAELRQSFSQRPLEWNNILEYSTIERLNVYNDRLIDKKKHKAIFQLFKTEDLLEKFGGKDCQDPREIFYQKAQFGFELILLLLIDDENEDRKNRRSLINKNMRYIGMSQFTHTQYDYLNSIMLCQSMNQQHNNKYVINDEQQDQDITFEYDINDNKSPEKLQKSPNINYTQSIEKLNIDHKQYSLHQYNQSDHLSRISQQNQDVLIENYDNIIED